MGKILLAFLCISFCLAQPAGHDPALGKEIDKWQYLNVVERDPKIMHAFQSEDGRTRTKAYLDSLHKVSDDNRYGQRFFLDSLGPKITVVLFRRTDEDIRNLNSDFRQFQLDAAANRKKLLKSNLSNLMFKDINGQQHSADQFKGNMVLLNFWFTKCAPCIKEMPDLNALQEKYKGYNVKFYAITHDELATVKRFLEKFKLDLTVVTDQKSMTEQLGLGFYPTNILMDETGRVLFVSEYFNPKGNDLEIIEKLIKKRSKKV